MTIPDDLKVTTEVLLRGAVIFAAIDAVFITILVRTVKPESFSRMKWKLALIMAIFFFLLFGSIVGIVFWNSVYSYVFPAWSRWIIPPAYGILFSIAGLLFWRISMFMRKNKVLVFLLLGGVWGIATHILAIFRGIMEKPPMLKGASPLAALVIAAFEFIFYWCVCLSLTKIITKN